MTNEEFLDRTSIKVSEDTFAAIHAIYLEAGDIDKDQFCADYKIHQDSLLLKIFYEQSDRFRRRMDKARGYIYEMADFLIDQAHICSSMDLRKKAIEILGIEEYLNRKLEKGYSLWNIDKTDLQEILGGHLKSQIELY